MEEYEENPSRQNETVGEVEVSVNRPADQEARRFVAAAATRCPKCNSQNVDFAAMDIVGQSAYQEASCQDCDIIFYVVYRLVGFALEIDGSMEIHTITEDFGQIKDRAEDH